MEERSVYLLLMTATRRDGPGHLTTQYGVTTVVSHNEEEARKVALESANKRWSASDGWRAPVIFIMLLSKQTLSRLIQACDEGADDTEPPQVEWIM